MHANLTPLPDHALSSLWRFLSHATSLMSASSRSFQRFLSSLSAFSDGGDDKLQQGKYMAERFAFLATIPTEENWPVQSYVLVKFQQETYSVANEEAYIHYLRRKTKWLEPRFRTLLMSIVEDLNECARKCEEAGPYASQSEHIAALGIDPKKYDLRISSAFKVQRTQA